MKKLVAAAVLLVASASTAYAAAPEALHNLAKACGLPCC
jgi:opacity protein-like surface antigen